MPATFSINSGQLTESTRKPNVLAVLNDIQDNTQKLISPRDVRDAFLSTWANSPFKITTPNSLANYEYIGLDSSNPGNRDIKQKILLGKRSYGNLDVMNNFLLSSEADIFLFNTKPDTITQSSTKIAILSGTNSNLYKFAPYIESYTNPSETKTDLNIINPSQNGAINLFSQTGRVSINDIVFPTVAETFGSASDGRILRYRGTYPSGYLKWEEPTITLNVIGTPGYATNIYGSTVSLNGYSLEFIEPDDVPTTIGGIEMGASFSGNSFYNGSGYQNWPITEVLKELLYPYTPPVLELSIVNNATGTIYAEVGKTASAVLTYKVTTYQRNVAEKIFNYQVVPQTSYVNLSLSGVPGTFAGATISVATYSAGGPAGSFIKTWSLNVSDSSLSTFSYSATASLEFVYPIWYGFTSSLITNPTTLGNITPHLSKLIAPYPGASNSHTLPFNGEGYLYFIHHKDQNWNNTSVAPEFSGLQQIKDPNGYIIHNRLSPEYSGFTSSEINHPVIPGVGGYPELFVVWRTKYLCSYPGPSGGNGTGDFKFIF
jgi:hypothetical protein